MKTQHTLVFALFFIALLAPVAQAASIDSSFPATVLAGHQVFLEKGSIDCDDLGAWCYVNWTNQDGSETGSFDEVLDSEGDPENANQLIVFSEPGTYLLEIRECAFPDSTGVCPASPDDSISIEVVDPSTLDTDDTASMEWTYSHTAGKLLTQGYAPADAVSVHLRLQPVDTTAPNTYPKLCRPVTQGANTEFTGTFNPLTDGWTNETYYVFANFYNDTNCNTGAGVQVFPSAFGGEFNYLHILEILAQLEELDAALNGTNATLQAQIDDLYNLTFDLTTDLALVEAEVADLADAIEQLNHGRINLVWNAATETLRVRLYFPVGAVSAEAHAYRADNDSLVHSVTGITPDADGAYNLDWDVSSWEPLQWTIKAQFLNGSGDRVGRWAAVSFDNLFIDWLADQLNLLEIELNNTNATLQAQIDDLQLQLDDVDTNLTAVWLEIQDIYDQLGLQNHGTINLHHFDADSTYHPDSLRVWGEAPFGAVTATAQLRKLDRTVVGEVTVPIGPLGANDNSYEVFFEPLNTYDPVKYQVRVFFNDSTARMPGYDVGALFDDLFLLYLYDWVTALNETVTNNTGNILENALQIELLWGNLSALEVRVEDLETAVADIEARLYGLPGDGFIWDLVEDYCTSESISPCRLQDFCADVQDTGLFDYILELEPTQLEFIMTLLGLANEADATFVWDACKQVQINELYWALYGTGEEAFLENSRNAWCGMREADAALNNEDPEDYAAYRRYCTNDFGTPSVNWASDVDDLGLEDRINRIAQVSWNQLSDVFDELLDIWTFLDGYLAGFNELNERVYEVYNQQTDFRRPLVFEFKPAFDDEGYYGFELIQVNTNNAEDITQTLVDCSEGGKWMESYSNNFIRTSVLYPPAEGIYRVKLRAISCATESNYDTSHATIIRVIDLANPWPENSLLIGTPMPQEELEGYDTNDVFWTSAASVSVVSLLDSGDGWFGGLGCDVDNYVSSSALEDYQTWEFANETNRSTTCEGSVNFSRLAGIGFYEGDVNRIKICAHPFRDEGLTVKYCDTVKLGFDNETPDVVEIFPAEENAVHGTIKFSASVTDNGALAVVEFSLLNKSDNGTLYGPFLGFYNETSSKWEAEVNTTEIDDGSYNLKVYAEDYAGNMIEAVIDPIVDNTPPVIEEVFLPDSFFAGAESVISVHVTDNLAGVDEVYVTLSAYWCGEPLGTETDEETNETEYLFCNAAILCDGEPSPYYGDDESQIVVTIPLSAIEGTSLNGTWSATINNELDELLNKSEEGIFFMVSVTANDATTDGEGDSGNEVTVMADNTNVHDGYNISITSVSPNPATAGSTVTVLGTLTSQGVDLSGETVNVAGGDVDVLMNAWTRNFGVSLVSQPIPIVATYTSVCGDVFTDEASVTVVQGSSGGGGGGGGGGGDTYRPPTTADNGNDQDDDNNDNGNDDTQRQEQENNDNGGEEQEGDSSTQGLESTSENDQTNEVDSNLVTGAVTGGGSDSWGWLVGLAVLIGIVLAGYFFSRKN